MINTDTLDKKVIPGQTKETPYRYRPLVVALVTFCILSLLCGTAIYLRAVIKQDQQLSRTQAQAEAIKDRLQQTLAHNISITKTLSLFIDANGNCNNFDSIAEEIFNDYKSIDALQIMPGGIITHIYPLKNNEVMIGYNVLTDPQRNRDAFKAINSGELFFAGPLTLKQGGIGIIGRMPVYRNSRFWGFTAVVIRLPTLLKASMIDTLGKYGYKVQLSIINDSTGNETFFLHSNDDFKTEDAVQVQVPTAQLRLYVKPAGRGIYTDIYFMTILGLLLSVVGSIFAYTMARRPVRLKKLVDERTSALQQSESKYRSLIEQASDGVIITGIDRVIQEVNKSACRLSGYTEHEVIGHNVAEFLSDIDEETNNKRRAAINNGQHLTFERQLIHKDGHVIDIELNTQLTTDGKLISFLRDITERKKAQELINLSNERFELIGRATKDAVWDYDIVANSASGSSNWYKLYGFDPDEKQSLNFDTFIQQVHPDERERIISNYDKLVKENVSSIAEEFRFLMPDGTYKNIYDRAYIKYDEQGKPVRMTGVMQDITERVSAEQAIISEKEMSDSIINSLPAIFYMYDIEGRFVRWNKNFQLVSGYSEEEVRNAHPLNFFKDEEKQLLRNKINSVFVNGYDNVVADFVTKDGRHIPYYFSGKKVELQGEPYLVGFGIDFTDNIKAQEVLKESEKKFRGMIEEAADGVAILSASANITYTSPSVDRILGYTENKIHGNDWFSLIHPADLAQATYMFQYCLQNEGLPVKADMLRMRHKRGHWCWIDNTLTNNLHIESIGGIVYNFRDVTDKVLIERKINAEKELSDNIINSLPAIFLLLNRKGKLIRWNHLLETTTGYTAHEIKDMHPSDFFTDADKPVIKNRISNYSNGLPGLELHLLTKEHESIPFYFSSLGIEYEKEPCIMAIGFDITRRLTTEKQLLVLNEDLERKATELINSYNELERFAYIVSHDLQEPLRMITSFLQLLQKKYSSKLDETGERYIHFAVDGAERMKKLIMDLLEYSRTGTSKDVAPNVNMNEVMDDLLKMLKTSMDELHATVEFSNLPVLHQVSKLQMFQLLQNLVGNALKYHSDQQPLIQVTAEEQPDAWLFKVKDNGIGIEQKFFDKIFIVFQRLHNKNEFSGTGIGLSICKKIVEKHGGKIWVESKPDEGSVFYFTISKQL